MILVGIKVNMQALIFAFKLNKEALFVADPSNGNFITDTDTHLFADIVDTISPSISCFIDNFRKRINLSDKVCLI